VCKVLDAPSNAVASHRSGKGAISLGTMNTPGLTTSKACLSIFNASGKEFKYPLDGSCEMKTIHDKFIAQGKLTIVWERPARTVLVSEAKPDVLRNFLQKLRAVLEGKNIESLKEITKEKKSDLGGQVELVVRRRDQYPTSSKSFPSASLKTLVLSGIGLKRVDGRWFSCTLLTSLDLSRNHMSAAPDLVKMKLIGRLVNLQVLNMSRNGLARLPVEMMSYLPPSLLHLDLSHNRFKSIPSLATVPSLSLLNMAYNQLESLPSELRSRRSLSLNLDNNAIRFIPYMLSNTRQTFSITGNALNEPASKPDLSAVRSPPSMLQWAMQSLKRNRFPVEELYSVYMVRFWDDEGIDVCDYCAKFFASDLLFAFVQLTEASTISVQAAFNTRYPTRIVSCRGCYVRRNPPAGQRRVVMPILPPGLRRMAVARRRN
ncbi:hypothetical protein PENTCL1PPCAC_1355, partial [Pristionchus entomophagus]